MEKCVGSRNSIDKRSPGLMLLSCCCFALLLATASARSHRLSSSSSSNAIDDSTDLMSRVPKSIGDMIGCKAVPSMKMFKFLNRICEDCFQLYRDPELYQMCRSDCFSSDVFVGCMDTLLVENEARMEAAALVDDIHSYY